MNCHHNNRIILEMSLISNIPLFTRVIMLQLLPDVDRLGHVRLAGSGLRWNPRRPTNLLIPPDNNGAHLGHRLSSVFIHRPKNAVIAQIERPDCLFWGNPFAVPLASPGTDFHRSGSGASVVPKTNGSGQPLTIFGSGRRVGCSLALWIKILSTRSRGNWRRYHVTDHGHSSWTRVV